LCTSRVRFFSRALPRVSRLKLCTSGVRFFSPLRVGVPADRTAAELAGRQHGYVTTEQLAAAGLGRRAIAHRVSIGWLERRHRGVYRFGPVRSPYGELMAAVLAYGDGTLLPAPCSTWQPTPAPGNSPGPSSRLRSSTS